MELTKREKLIQYFKNKELAKTSEVIFWGLNNYCNTADRIARKLKNDKIIRRLKEKEKIKIYGKIKEDVWQYIGKNIKE